MNQEKKFHFPTIEDILPSLFFAKARRTDPDTSKQAARSVKVSLEDTVLEGIRSFSEGCTADELVERLQMRWDSVTPRFKPLLNKNLIVDTGLRRRGASGRMQRVVRAV